MKRFILVTVLNCIYTFSVFSQQTIIVTPQEIVTLPQVKYDNLQIRDDPGQEGLKPYFETERGLVFIMKDGIYRFDDNFKSHFIPMSTLNAWSGRSSILSSRFFTIGAGLGFSIQRYGDTYSEKDTFERYGSIGVSLLIDNMVFREDGSSLVIEPDLTVRVLSRAETLEYAKANIPDATVEGSELYYRGNKVGRTIIRMIDDDGNFYSSITMYRDSRTICDITFEQYDYWYHVFDHEGNVLAFKNSADGLIVYYAGRTWGYQEPARKAVVTSDNVRIRLRSNTESFILGKVQDKEQITVLKTGPSATIGGQTAPWYRIKTANGMVGWVFGAFVKITGIPLVPGRGGIPSR